MNQVEIICSDKYLGIVPRPTKEEYQALKESIIIEGQQEPITINGKGVILDGHTRYSICNDIGRNPKYVIKDFKSKNDEILYVINCNLIRRQLNNFQKIELASSLYKIIKAQQRYGGDRRKVKKVGSTSAIVGRRIGLNRNLVQQGIWLLENAGNDTIIRLRNGTASITKTYDRIRNTGVKRISRSYKKRSVVCPHCNKVSKRSEWGKVS